MDFSNPILSPAHDCVSMVTLSRILTGEKAAMDVYTVHGGKTEQRERWKISTRRRKSPTVLLLQCKFDIKADKK